MSLHATARPPATRLVLAAAILLVCVPSDAQQRGQADVGSQGYYLGGSSQKISDISGAFMSFRDFIPDVGQIKGSIEGYGREGKFAAGDNYIELNGAAWAGMRWNVAGGDFRVSAGLIEIPFTNVFYPEISARGFRLESHNSRRRIAFFIGNETLLSGPRVPYRIKAPQSVMALSWLEKFGERLQVGARLARFASSEKSIDENPFFFPAGRDFTDVKTLTTYALFAAGHLKIYGEAGVSDAARPGDTKSTLTPSLFAGPSWDTTKLSIRGNYIYETAAYLPVVGFFLGDRKGPFGEVRYRPADKVELYASASRYESNLEHDPSLPTYDSSGFGVGGSIGLPWKIAASGQLSVVRFQIRSPDLDGPQTSNNRQVLVTLGRPFGRHNLRVSYRDLRLNSVGNIERQHSAEIEDTFRVRKLMLGAAVREQRLETSGEHRNSLFVRGSLQTNVGRFSAYAYVEAGKDLVNRTVFATSTVSTSVVGVAARLTKDWNFQAEAFRNSLVSDLNPESAFLLGNQGIGVSRTLSALNQWSVYFRLTRQIRWGGGLPPEGLERYTAEQIPLVGVVEGIVQERTLAGFRPAAQVPVRLDGSRTIVTAADGRYRFADVAEGTHKAGLALDELPSEYDPGAAAQTEVSVEPRRTSRADFEVVRLAEVRGAVTGPAGQLEGILIRLSPGARYTTTDADGVFAFHNLREGDYEAVLDPATLAADTGLVGTATVAVSVRAGAPTPQLRFQIEPRTVEIKVRKTFEQDGRQR